MNIIKLSAINSTNDYLKSLSSTRHVENFTFVVAAHQTAGRGQMGAKWDAEPGKNLTFSVLIKDLLLAVNEIFTLNVAVAVSVAEALNALHLPEVCIKWPNDILAGNKKLGGILIENSIKNDGEIFSVVGIGLNVNQKDFDELPKATSLAVVAGRDFDKEQLLLEIAGRLRQNVSKILNKDSQSLWARYHELLFKKGMPMPFEKDNEKFMGIIQGVTATGSLSVLLADDTMADFGIKEVQLLY
jgi:BirA family biotin operon repressor/biotin-[acetyl-CoA-carboxylase] ligase